MATIGIRGRGQDHISAFSHRKDTAVVALCDVDSRLFDSSSKKLEDRTGKAPQLVTDLRRIMDDKTIDVVTVATPNHWHALAAVWACQAGKDVYVEKPISHNVSEGRKIAEAARKYGKIVQAGTQNRSGEGVRQAMDFLHSGGLGPVYLARGLCFKPRGSIGIKADAPVPEGVDYNIWLGPAPERPFNPNRFHYEWHWNWDYGNGDLGNQGIHQMDVARWGLGKDTHSRPTSCRLWRPVRLQGRRPDSEHANLSVQIRRLHARIRSSRPTDQPRARDQVGQPVLRSQGMPGNRRREVGHVHGAQK